MRSCKCLTTFELLGYVFPPCTRFSNQILVLFRAFLMSKMSLRDHYFVICNIMYHSYRTISCICWQVKHDFLLYHYFQWRFYIRNVKGKNAYRNCKMEILICNNKQYTILLNCFIYLNPLALLYSKCSISCVDINHC